MTEKTKVINTRFSEREKQIVEQYAAACGLSRSEYLRKRVLGYEPRPAVGILSTSFIVSYVTCVL